VIVVLGIVAAVAIPKMGGLSQGAKLAATKSEMQGLRAAILGSPDAHGVPRGGYEIDVGYPPGQLLDLARKPDSVQTWNTFLERGWNGPYIDSTGGNYLRDAWDSTYTYSSAARTLTSKGSGSNVVVSF
jgi:type II secretory pathway pseudopilin PulG